MSAAGSLLIDFFEQISQRNKRHETYGKSYNRIRDEELRKK